MGVRLVVARNGAEVGSVETETEDDFMYFRDSVCISLEGNDFGARFPVFQRKLFTDWEAGEVATLEKALLSIHADMRRLPPMPSDGSWRSKLAMSRRKPESLPEVFIDRTAHPWSPACWCLPAWRARTVSASNGVEPRIGPAHGRDGQTFPHARSGDSFPPEAAMAEPPFLTLQKSGFSAFGTSESLLL
jgi:hypothetical protein